MAGEIRFPIRKGRRPARGRAPSAQTGKLGRVSDGGAGQERGRRDDRAVAGERVARTADAEICPMDAAAEAKDEQPDRGIDGPSRSEPAVDALGAREAVFRTIIWATDGSASAANALPVAKALAQTTDAELVLAHIEEIAIGRAGAPISTDEETLGPLLHQHIEELQRDGIKAELRSRRAPAGSAAAAIADLAEHAHADLIVTGSRGRNPLAGLILGSVTLRLLQTAPCPVLVVPEQTG
jgi:nucleotide-binding universal stress UspA family protein